MSEEKQRHGCLTVWLVLIIILNSLTAVTYLFAGALLRKFTPATPVWAFPVLAICGVLNVAFAIALFQWKKWGFFGFIATAIVIFVVNLEIGIKPIHALFGLAGVSILYGVLQIGKDKKGWTQLG